MSYHLFKESTRRRGIGPNQESALIYIFSEAGTLWSTGIVIDEQYEELYDSEHYLTLVMLD